MKISVLSGLFLSIFIINGVVAQESFDIDKSIERIKNAPQEDRRELMNRFKKILAKMNRAERMKAISKLKESVLGTVESTSANPFGPRRNRLDAPGGGSNIQLGRGVEGRVAPAAPGGGRHGGRP